MASAIGSTWGAFGQEEQGRISADAQGSAAMAQRAEAQKMNSQLQAQAAPTAMELATMNTQLQAANTQLQRQQKIYDAMDPALLESGKQALALMQGQNAATIQPMLAQREVQRQQLMQQLQTQLGPGFAASSAGQQALANFDMQTNTMQAQLQQQAIQTLGTYGTQVAQSEQTGYMSGQQAAGLFGNVMGQQNTLQQRQLGATQVGEMAMMGTAGAPYVGTIANAKNKAGFYGQMGGIANQWEGIFGKMYGNYNSSNNRQNYGGFDSSYSQGQIDQGGSYGGSMAGGAGDNNGGGGSSNDPTANVGEAATFAQMFA